MNERNVGIDMLRIVSTIMVVFLHVLSQGGILKALGDFNVKGEIMWFLQIICYSAVNIFALISGYIGFGKKHRIESLLMLWLQVALYSLLSMILIGVFAFERVSVKECVGALLPVVSGQSWYFSAYFPLFLLMPILDMIIDCIDKKVLIRGGISVFLFFLVAETFVHVEEFGINKGYSVLWLMLLYLVGAYIKKYNIQKKLTSKRCLVGIFICTVMTFLSKLAIEGVTLIVVGRPVYGTKFIAYTSPLMVAQAIFFLVLFLHIRVKSCIAKLVSWLSPMTFGVYIIHTTNVVYRYLLRDAFVFLEKCSLLGIICVSIMATAIIYVICSIIDWVRIKLFAFLGVGNLLKNITNKFNLIPNLLSK